MSEKEDRIVEYNTLVTSTAKEASDLILDKLESIAHKGHRWLLYARIINLLFGFHYKISLESAEKQIDEYESTQEKPNEESQAY